MSGLERAQRQQLSCDAPRRHAVLDALRPLLSAAARRRFVTQSVTQGMPALEREER
ncbi:Unknown protein sequence [Pseudomonas syringae pv. maculicola]|nr:Unknown protein sequence [Pseudomonas syringae pv. maculicola]